MAVQHSIVALLVTLTVVSAFVLPENFGKEQIEDVLEELQLPRSKRQSETVPGGNPMIALISSMFDDADTRPHDGRLDEDEMWSILNSFDGDGDGRITLREYVGLFNLGLLPGLRNMRNRSHMASLLFDEEDIDGDRVLTRNDATIVFHNVDLNRDQFLSKTEYFERWKEVMDRLGRINQAAGDTATYFYY